MVVISWYHTFLLFLVFLVSSSHFFKFNFSNNSLLRFNILRTVQRCVHFPPQPVGPTAPSCPQDPHRKRQLPACKLVLSGVPSSGWATGGACTEGKSAVLPCVSGASGNTCCFYSKWQVCVQRQGWSLPNSSRPSEMKGGHVVGKLPSI